MKILFIFVAWLYLFTGSGSINAGEYKPSGSLPVETTYVFAPHPYLNPQELFNAYDPVMRYLERKIPGTKFSIETSKDYAAYENKIAERRFHFGLPNPYQTIFSLKHGYRVIAKMKPDEDFRGMMVVRKDRKLSNPHDLTGQTLCFPSPTAVAATMLPMLYLNDHGLDLHGGVQIKYVGSQISSIMNAYTGDAAACGTTVRYWRTWSRDNPDKAKELETLWLTNSLPHNGVIARDDVPPKLAQQVAEALIGMEKDMELDQTQFKIDQAHFEPGSNDTYQPMAAFLKHYDESIGLPPQMQSK
jgi:phosphonate transport system substrate-binding protein